MAAAEVDVGYIAGHLDLDVDLIEAANTQPTVELVHALLQAVVAKANEFEELTSEKLRVDIELENAVRGAENRYQASRSTADGALRTVEELRQKLQSEESRRQVAENDLQTETLKSGEHDSRVKSFEQTISNLQESHQAALSILEDRNSTIEQLTAELEKQQQKASALATENGGNLTKLREAEAQVSTIKYREESLKQQLELASRNAEWFETELKAKSEESLKYRKEKAARISELQRQHEDVKMGLEGLKRSEQQLKERLEAAQAKADDAFVKVQQQQEAFARAEESYKQEIKDQKRLVQMTQDYSKNHQQRVQEVETERERLKDNYENEIRRVRLELEKESQNSHDFGERVTQLESELAVLAEGAVGSTPQTPRANGASAFAGSPHATPVSFRKNNVSVTQALEEYYKLKGQLMSEKKRNQQMAEEVEGLMLALEAKIPEINELQAESETLRAEITKMSQLSQQSFEERDLAKKQARKAEADSSTARAETKILRTQIRDLSMQIQMLVFNLHVQEKGVDQLTNEEALRFDQLARGEISENALADMSETHQFITQKFTIFKDIYELQSQNAALNSSIRELTDKMEHEEELAAQARAANDREEVLRLDQELQNMSDEARSLKMTMESYKAERDMFRRLLQQRATAVELASALGSNLDDGQRPPLASIETGLEDDSAATASALREQQVLFDSFRNEQATVRRSMQEKIDELSSDKVKLHSEIASMSAQATLASERYSMLQSNFTALQSEIKHVQESNRSMSTNCAKQDARMQQLADELVHAQSLVDGLQKEASNLRAEKELWRDIQNRLNKDNENLMLERGRMNAMIATQESTANQRALDHTESQRRAENRISNLEKDLHSTQDKLAKEIEDNKQLQLRKEYETKESQRRIDELTASLRQGREDLVSVKTSRDHLQARVNELMAELRNAEDRFGRLLPRATPRAGAHHDANDDDDTNPVIQELTGEISDLKRELELVKMELANANEQLGHQREMGRQLEEELQDLTATRKEFGQEMEDSMKAKDMELQRLNQQVADITSELNRSNEELSRLRDSQAEARRSHEVEKSALVEENTRLQTDAQREAENARFHQQDLRAQADIAAKAHEDYEAELVRHAEAARQLQQLRADYKTVREQLFAHKTEAESAKLALTQGEGSWQELRAQLKQENCELTNRYDDANAQNRLLHQQLESISNQVAALQRNRTASAQPLDPSAATTDTTVDGLRELNNYLRREKEILEVQFDIKTSEARRIQEQLDVTRLELDDLRLKLEQERRAHAESGRTVMSHKGLMDKLHELNLYRESSATLRTELEQARQSVAAKSTKVDELAGRVQPLQAEIENLRSQKVFLEEEMASVQKDRDYWKKRHEDILTRYGRVDPAEMEDLNKKMMDMEAERDASRAAEEQLNSKVVELATLLETERSNWGTTREKLVAQFKERSKRITTDKNEALQRTKELEQQLAAANSSVEMSTKELAMSKDEAAALGRQVVGFMGQIQQLKADDHAADQADPVLADGAAPAAEVTAQLEQQLGEIRAQLDLVTTQKTSAEADLNSLRARLAAAQAERDSAIAGVQRQQLAAAEPVEAVPETTRQAPADVPEEENASDPTTTDEARRKLADSEAKIFALEQKVAELESKLAEAKAQAGAAETWVQEIEANNNKVLKERSDKMRTSLNDKLRESKVKLEEEFRLKLEQEKLIWQAENVLKPRDANAAGDDNALVASTPTKQQQPATPLVPAFTAPPGSQTPDVSSTKDLAQLSDLEIRAFLASNQTVKGILSANLKKRVDAELTKAKAEHEMKVAQVRESTEQLVTKKSSLRLNMAENKLRAAQVKIDYVSTAAAETPAKAVGEVWQTAKALQPQPQQQQQQQQQQPQSQARTQPQPQPQPQSQSQPATTAAALPSLGSPAQRTPTQQSTPVVPSVSSSALPSSPAVPSANPALHSSLPQKPAPAPTKIPVNPFTAFHNATNPFAKSAPESGHAAAATASVVQPHQNNNAQHGQQQQQQQQQQPQQQPQGFPGQGMGRGSNNPTIRGGRGGGRGGPQGQGGRGGGPGGIETNMQMHFGQRGGGGGRGGRGGGRGNPAAGHENGKRPLVDPEGGPGGNKRVKGGGGAH